MQRPSIHNANNQRRIYIHPNKRYFAIKQNTPQQPVVFNKRISYVDIVSLKKEKRCYS